MNSRCKSTMTSSVSSNQMESFFSDGRCANPVESAPSVVINSLGDPVANNVQLSNPFDGIATAAYEEPHPVDLLSAHSCTPAVRINSPGLLSSAALPSLPVLPVPLAVYGYPSTSYLMSHTPSPISTPTLHPPVAVPTGSAAASRHMRSHSYSHSFNTSNSGNRHSGPVKEGLHRHSNVHHTGSFHSQLYGSSSNHLSSLQQYTGGIPMSQAPSSVYFHPNGCVEASDHYLFPYMHPNPP